MQLSWMNLNISAKKLILEEYLHILTFKLCMLAIQYYLLIFKNIYFCVLVLCLFFFLGGGGVKYCFFNLFHEFSI